jgi:ribokinase
MVSSEGENMIAVAPGANASARSDQVPDDLLCARTTLVTQMEVPPSQIALLIRRLRAHGGRSVLNLAPALPVDFALLEEIDLLVANEGEVAATGSDPELLARRLRQGLVVTRGAVGALTILRDGIRIEVPALAIEPVDTTGAGDTFVGVLAATLDLGSTLVTALRRASAAAGLACLARGAQTAMPNGVAIAAAVDQLSP